jgi:hypothetical protein
VRQWLLGERVKGLLTKDIYGPRTLYIKTSHAQAKNRS